MFSRHDKTYTDLSAELNDESDWKVGTLKPLRYHLDICTLAFEPVSGLLAIGTASGYIHIYGSPGVEISLAIPDRSRSKLLYFSSSTFHLLCIDSLQRLLLWNLSTHGKPRLQNIYNYRHSVNYVTLSPSHTHAFVALSNGEIKTYDLLCSRNSQYTLPNMWALYEEKVAASGMPAYQDPGSQVPVEVVIHPRDLNLVLVAYGGGVVLSDLTQMTTLRTYEHVLPPGAPGGTGYHHPELMNHSRPSVTAIAVHPTGHFFAVGYADGCIAFWALEDEDKPLLVMTLEEKDVHAVDASRLEEVMSGAAPSDQVAEREPIFKLAWSGYPNSSDPRGGDTTLTILGGLRTDESPAVTVLLFPPFNPTEAPQSPDPQAGLHPVIRDAMRQSLNYTNTYSYFTRSIVQDFLLIPRDNPHFSGTYDPVAILLLSDHDGDTKALEGYEFPPPSLISVAKTIPEEVPTSVAEQPEDDEDDLLAKELANTLESMKLELGEDPKPLRLPASLWNGPNGVISGQLVAIDKSAYEILIQGDDLKKDFGELQLRGGVAWVDDPEGEMKLMKVQPIRLLITHHRDLTVRFQELNARRLVSSEEAPLTASFPNPLPALTIDLACVLADSEIVARTSPRFADEALIDSVHFAIESLETAVTLKTGELFLYRSVHGESTPGMPKQLEDRELVSLQHASVQPGRRYKPMFALMPERGRVAAFALSDIGFTAASYTDGSLFVVDMRGPKVILRVVSDGKGEKHSFLHKHEPDPFTSLAFAVSGTATERIPQVLLIATRDSGATSIYTVYRTAEGSWAVKDMPAKTDAVPHPLPNSSIVIDSKTGYRCSANRNGLSSVLAPPPDIDQKKTLWINAGSKGVRCVVDITGEKIGKADWGSKLGKVERIEVVQKNAAAVLVAYTDRRQASIYSLPILEHMHTLQMEQASLEPLSPDSTGDYVEWIRHPASGLIRAAHYGTLFDVRRSGPYAAPQVKLASDTDSRAIPPQPQPVPIGPQSLIGSWLGYITSQSMTGEQIDVLLAGPDRPIPPPTQRAQVAQGSQGASNTPLGSIDARKIASSASNTASDLYNRLGSALAERGEALGQLQESFDSLEQGSKKMLAQSKSLATQQTAKRWFGF
ncbi:hypothetical protein K474DRAFT_1656898 [Panus rudis PR-1116 ss-1]|nr:hypothetical protein K474DRAFT_1656898 [Panus rudis PR-1116 ss-1]